MAVHEWNCARSTEGMTTHPSARFSLLQAIGLFMGATFFAYLLSLTLHELGHYLASVLLGVPGKGIVLHPFGANCNIYLKDLTTAFGTPERRIVASCFLTSHAGPWANAGISFTHFGCAMPRRRVTFSRSRRCQSIRNRRVQAREGQRAAALAVEEVQSGAERLR